MIPTPQYKPKLIGNFHILWRLSNEIDLIDFAWDLLNGFQRTLDVETGSTPLPPNLGRNPFSRCQGDDKGPTPKNIDRLIARHMFDRRILAPTRPLSFLPATPTTISEIIYRIICSKRQKHRSVLAKQNMATGVEGASDSLEFYSTYPLQCTALYFRSGCDKTENRAAIALYLHE